jgi:CelD/BcsL family acetyltransferase involved in cellulose biosynthesis
MRIQLVDRIAELQPFAHDWNRLLQASSANGVFLTWEWISRWWEVYGGERKLTVLLAWRAAELVGIAPLMIGKHPSYGSARPRVLMMIGQGGDTLAERFAFISAPNDEDELAKVFVRHLLGPLAGSWDMILFERMLDSPAKDRLVAALEESRLTVEMSAEHLAPYATLPNDMEAFLASRSRNFRSQYRSSCKKLEQLGDVRLRYAGTDIAISDAIQTLARLHRERFAEESTSFRSDAYVRFHTRLAETFFERGWLWLVVLEVAGESIAARYDYVYANKVWCMQGGWDPRFGAVRPGMVLTGAVIQWAIERGLAEYDFLCGEEAYKNRWSDAERRMTSVQAFNPATLVGRVLPVVRTAKRAVRALFRDGGVAKGA